MSVRILEGDSLTVLRTLPDESVHCCVTSPPYWGLRNYGVDGQIGLESSPAEFVAVMVDVFREVRRVLRNDGTLWLNLGDSYNAAGRTGHGTREGFKQDSNRASNMGADDVRPSDASLKPKDLVGIPWRVAFALQADGWYLRQDIIWCLSGGAWVYARTQKGDMPVMVKDLVRLKPSTVKLWNGTKWTRVLGWGASNDTGQRMELVLRSGERIGCTGGHPWPTQRGNVAARDLRPGDVIQTCRLPEPATVGAPMYLTRDLLWLIGLYLAEGSRAGDTIQLSLNTDEAPWLERIEAAADGLGASMTHTKRGSNLSVRLYGRVLAAAIEEFIGGKTAHDKHLRAPVWNLPGWALRCIADGYLDGDGHWDQKARRWRLGFARNYALERDLRTLAARLGATLTLHPGEATYRGGKKPSFRGEWRWNRTGHRNEKDRGEVVEIRASRARKFWDIAVEDEPHLFALASGVLTHNCKPNPMPESVRDRCTKAHEYLFLLSKSERYYYDNDAIKEDCVQDESRPSFRGGAYCNNSTFDNAEGGKSTDTGNVRRSWNGSQFHTGKTGEHQLGRSQKVRSPAGWKTGPGAHGSVHDQGRAQEVTYAEIDATKRNKRSVWTVATQPFNGSRFVDGADGDTGRIRSSDCPVHGDHCPPVSTARNGGQPAASRSARNQRTGGRPDQSQQDALFPIETPRDEGFSPDSSDSPARAYSDSATASSNQSHKTGRALETSLHGIDAEGSGPSIDDSEPLPLQAAISDRIPESNTAPDASLGEQQIDPSERTVQSNAGKCSCRIVDHFATFPPALIEPCILAGCPAGGVVLDPFGGAGTTGLVSDRHGRDAILIELNPEYAAMARRRIAGDSPLFAEVA